MSENINGNGVEWERLANVLLNGISEVRKMPQADNSITLYDDLIEIGATEEEARFLIQQAKRLGIELK